MAIIADLDDLSASEFLLLLSLNRKTGRLSAVNGDQKVLLAFRDGAIVYAASTAVRERVGSILVSRNLVTEDTLRYAIAQQKQERGVKHLGNILVEMGVITQEALEDVVRSQFQKVLAELLSWQQGVITFARMDIPDLGAVHVNFREILVDMGFETEQLLLGTLSDLEGSGIEPQAGPGASRAADEAEPDEEQEREAQELMRSMMAEMQSLSLAITGEISLEILTSALDVVRRCVLVLVFADHASGVGGFGMQTDTRSSEEVVRSFLVPRSQETIFSWVIEHGETYRGPLQDTPYNREIIDQLGGLWPDDVVAVPLVVDDRTAAVLYGDNAVDGSPIGPHELLEAIMAQAGSTIESQRRAQRD